MNTTAIHPAGRARTGLGQRALALLIVISGALACTVATTAVAPEAANAACASTLTGTWRNIDANTRSIARVDLTMATCGDTVQCDADTGQCHRTQTTYRIRVFGKCHPTDCDWGERTTVDAGGGWQQATYQYAWATKQVWVKTYQFYGRTYLRVWVNTDFTPADGRQDYVSDEWMLR